MSVSTEEIKALENALNEGRIFEAHNLASELSEKDRGNVRVIQLQALALARLKQPGKALDLMDALYSEGHRDEETTGILARIHKDLYLLSRDKSFLKRSTELYLEGFQKTNHYYPAINASTLLRLQGKDSDSSDLAKRVIDLIENADDYWSLATLGEANLLAGNFRDAATFYRRAVELDPSKFGQINSTKGQLSLLSTVIKIPEEIEKIFPTPVIAFCVGHMIDHPSRKHPRFPQEIEFAIGKEIEGILSSLGVNIGFTSAACGADILFVEALKKIGAEVNLYLPFAKDDFMETSVSFAGSIWLERFEAALSEYLPRYVTTGPFYGNDDVFRHMGLVMMGECLLLAEHYNTKPYAISVLTEDDNGLPGGTQDLTCLWPIADRLININPSKYLSKISADSTGPEDSEVTVREQDYHITNILFADIVGFSKIPEKETGPFVVEAMSLIADFLKKKLFDPVVFNTWGDAILMTHPDAEVLVQIAMELQRIFREGQWYFPEKDLRPDIRIALHSGPAFFSIDPLTRRQNAYGDSINRAARMEPVTLPGAIYASSSFAANLAVAAHDKYSFSHVGIVKLPKNFGQQEVYEVNAI